MAFFGFADGGFRSRMASSEYFGFGMGLFGRNRLLWHELAGVPLLMWRNFVTRNGTWLEGFWSKCFFRGLILT